jgi:hypothetical protein
MSTLTETIATTEKIRAASATRVISFN